MEIQSKKIIAAGLGLIIAVSLILAFLYLKDDEKEEKEIPLSAEPGDDREAFIIKDEKEEVTIYFDGSNSTGDIVNYEWDFDKTGAFETDAEGETAFYTYQKTGEYVVRLKVTEGNGFYDINYTKVHINYKQYDNDSIKNDEEKRHPFPVEEKCIKTYARIFYKKEGRVGVVHNIDISFKNAKNEDVNCTDSGESEKEGVVEKWIAVEGRYVASAGCGEWKVVLQRNDDGYSVGDDSLDYELEIRAQY